MVSSGESSAERITTTPGPCRLGLPSGQSAPFDTLAARSNSVADRVQNLRILKALRTKEGKLLMEGQTPRACFNVAVASLLLNGIQTRMQTVPAFTEVKSADVITVLAENEPDRDHAA